MLHMQFDVHAMWLLLFVLQLLGSVKNYLYSCCDLKCCICTHVVLLWFWIIVGRFGFCCFSGQKWRFRFRLHTHIQHRWNPECKRNVI